MSQRSRISELSAIIQTNTSKIDEHLSAEGLAPLSFDVHSSSQPPDAILPFQTAILEATDELNALVQGPMPFIINLTVSNVLKSLILTPCLPRSARERKAANQRTNRALTAQFPGQPTRNLPLQHHVQHPHRRRSHLRADSGAM